MVLRSGVLERKWKITGTPHHSSPLRLPGRREAECPPYAGVLLAQPVEPPPLPGRQAQPTQDQAASHPHPPGSWSAA